MTLQLHLSIEDSILLLLLLLQHPLEKGSTYPSKQQELIN
jgi:hypothetical protein